jgi:hypothetical protein
VPRKIRYQYPNRAIYYDVDGTLTGKGPNSWATPYFLHNLQSECTADLPMMDGITCNNQVEVRRVAFRDFSPAIFRNMEMKVLKFDSAASLSEADLATYIDDTDNYSEVFYKMKKDPEGWAAPFVTNHKYKIHWRNGLDFMTANFDLSERWSVNDKSVYFIFNHTDVRAKINVITTNNEVIPNETLTTKMAAGQQLYTGDNIIYNDTATK